MSRDVNKLKEPFRSSVKELIKKAKADGIPVLVTDTTRTFGEQKELKRRGLSRTLASKHLTGHAVDIAFLVNGKLSYNAKLYDRLYEIAKDLPYIIWPYRDLIWNWDKAHFQYAPDKRNASVNVKKLFTNIWKRRPARGEELYFLKRVELGSIKPTRQDISNKIKYYYQIVYPHGKYSWLGDLRWQWEKLKVLTGN